MSTNVINTLKPFTWRGVTVPCSSIQTTFGHRQAERVYPFIDAEGHSSTGRKGKRVTLKLHFINTIDPDLYPKKWTTFRKFLDDGSAGKFFHPDLGKFDAVVIDGDYEISPESSAGITVNVTFNETVVDLDKNTNFVSPVADAKAAASQVDKALETLGIDYPDGTGDLNLSESLASLASDLTLFPQLIEGKINAIEGTIENLMDRFDAIGQAWEGSSEALRDSALGDPARLALLLGLHIVFDALETLRIQVKSQARPTSIKVLTGDRSFASLAEELGNDIGDLMLLNAALASVPVAPAGSSISYYTS